MTPGVTPAGTRDIRTFFGAGREFKPVGAFTVVESEVWGEGRCGGGTVSRVEVIDVGSESNTRRKPVFIKSRWLWDA